MPQGSQEHGNIIYYCFSLGCNRTSATMVTCPPHTIRQSFTSMGKNLHGREKKSVLSLTIMEPSITLQSQYMEQRMDAAKKRKTNERNAELQWTRPSTSTAWTRKIPPEGSNRACPRSWRGGAGVSSDQGVAIRPCNRKERLRPMTLRRMKNSHEIQQHPPNHHPGSQKLI